MTERVPQDSTHPTADAEMAGFMAWRIRFKRAVEAVDLALVPPIWREHVRVYQEAWRQAQSSDDTDPRATARTAVRLWLQARSGIA